MTITVQKHAKYFKPFQSRTMITYLELRITDGVSVSTALNTVFENTVWCVN
jgi:hypothetical protein